MNRRSLDLILAITITLAAVALTLLEVGNTATRVIFALLLVFVLPGYAVTAAAFPERTLGVAERLLFVLGLSVTFAALEGLVLNWTPWGLRTNAWMILQSGITLGASAVAMVRRQSCNRVASRRLNIDLDLRQGLLLGLAVLAAAGAVGAARIGALQQHGLAFTQLWILPAEDTGQDMVRLGVRNMEAVTLRYKLQLKVGGSVVHEWPSIELKSGEQWTTTVVFPARQASLDTIESVLYRLDAPAVIYRQVWLKQGNSGD